MPYKKQRTNTITCQSILLVSFFATRERDQCHSGGRQYNSECRWQRVFSCCCDAPAPTVAPARRINLRHTHSSTPVKPFKPNSKIDWGQTNQKPRGNQVSPKFSWKFHTRPLIGYWYFLATLIGSSSMAIQKCHRWVLLSFKHVSATCSLPLKSGMAPLCTCSGTLPPGLGVGANHI